MKIKKTLKLISLSLPLTSPIFASVKCVSNDDGFLEFKNSVKNFKFNQDFMVDLTSEDYQNEIDKINESYNKKALKIDNVSHENLANLLPKLAQKDSFTAEYLWGRNLFKFKFNEINNQNKFGIDLKNVFDAGNGRVEFTIEFYSLANNKYRHTYTFEDNGYRAYTNHNHYAYSNDDKNNEQYHSVEYMYKFNLDINGNY